MPYGLSLLFPSTNIALLTLLILASSMQVMCHMTFIIDLAHCGVFVAQSIGARNPKESKGLRFDSSWGLRIFFCPTLVTRQKNIFLYKNGYVRFDAIS